MASARPRDRMAFRFIGSLLVDAELSSARPAVGHDLPPRPAPRFGSTSGFRSVRRSSDIKATAIRWPPPSMPRQRLHRLRGTRDLYGPACRIDASLTPRALQDK